MNEVPISQNQLNSTIESIKKELNLPERQKKILVGKKIYFKYDQTTPKTKKEGLSSLAYDSNVRDVIAKHPGYWDVIEQLQQTNAIQTLTTNPMGLIKQEGEMEIEQNQGPASPPPKPNLSVGNEEKMKKQEHENSRCTVANQEYQQQPQHLVSQKVEEFENEEAAKPQKSLYNTLLENISRYITTLFNWMFSEPSKTSTAVPLTQQQSSHDEDHPYLRSFVVVGVAFVLIAVMLRSDPSQFKLSVEEGKDFSR